MMSAPPARNGDVMIAPGVTVSREMPSNRAPHAANPLQDAMAAVEQALAAAAVAAKVNVRSK